MIQSNVLHLPFVLPVKVGSQNEETYNANVYTSYLRNVHDIGWCLKRQYRITHPRIDTFQHENRENHHIRVYTAETSEASVRSIVANGLECRTDPITKMCVGDVEKGVTTFKHPDLLMRWVSETQPDVKEFYLITYKLSIGRVHYLSANELYMRHSRDYSGDIIMSDVEPNETEEIAPALLKSIVYSYERRGDDFVRNPRHIIPTCITVCKAYTMCFPLKVKTGMNRNNSVIPTTPLSPIEIDVDVNEATACESNTSDTSIAPVITKESNSTLVKNDMDDSDKENVSVNFVTEQNDCIDQSVSLSQSVLCPPVIGSSPKMECNFTTYSDILIYEENTNDFVSVQDISEMPEYDVTATFDARRSCVTSCKNNNDNLDNQVCEKVLVSRPVPEDTGYDHPTSTNSCNNETTKVQSCSSATTSVNTRVSNLVPSIVQSLGKQSKVKEQSNVDSESNNLLCAYQYIKSTRNKVNTVSLKEHAHGERPRKKYKSVNRKIFKSHVNVKRFPDSLMNKCNVMEASKTSDILIQNLQKSNLEKSVMDVKNEVRSVDQKSNENQRYEKGKKLKNAHENKESDHNVKIKADSNIRPKKRSSYIETKDNKIGEVSADKKSKNYEYDVNSSTESLLSTPQSSGKSSSHVSSRPFRKVRKNINYRISDNDSDDRELLDWNDLIQPNSAVGSQNLSQKLSPTGLAAPILSPKISYTTPVTQKLLPPKLKSQKLLSSRTSATSTSSPAISTEMSLAKTTKQNVTASKIVEHRSSKRILRSSTVKTNNPQTSKKSLYSGKPVVFRETVSERVKRTIKNNIGQPKKDVQ